MKPPPIPAREPHVPAIVPMKNAGMICLVDDDDGDGGGGGGDDDDDDDDDGLVALGGDLG